MDLSSWDWEIRKNVPQLDAPNQTVRLVHFFVGYLGPTNSDQLIVCCVGTVLPITFCTLCDIAGWSVMDILLDWADKIICYEFQISQRPPDLSMLYTCQLCQIVQQIMVYQHFIVRISVWSIVCIIFEKQVLIDPTVYILHWYVPHSDKI